MRRSLTLTFAAAAIAALSLVLTACSPSTSADSGGATTPVSADAIILDVRTAEEYASGHLEGAELLDFNSGAVAAAIPSLDPEAEYLVYCRSGNRSGQAIALMEQAGFTNVTNLGSLEQAASSTGLPIAR